MDSGEKTRRAVRTADGSVADRWEAAQRQLKGRRQGIITHIVEQVSSDSEPVTRVHVAAPAVVPEVLLLVEDDLSVRTVTRRMLEHLGYTVIEAGDGAEALALFRNSAIDLVLIDVVMPGMSGTHLAGAMRACEPSIKILLTSGYIWIDEQDPIPAGAAFLQKPFVRDALAKKVREVLDSAKIAIGDS